MVRRKRHIPRKRPFLTLCSPCNHRAFDAGKKAETEGVELCAACVVAVDAWHGAKAAFDRRRVRNKRKAERRARA